MRYAVNFEIDNGSYRILQEGAFNSKSKKEAIYEIINYAKNFSQEYSKFKDANRERREITIKIFGLKDADYQKNLILDLINKKSISKFKFNENYFKIKCSDLEAIVLKKKK